MRRRAATTSLSSHWSILFRNSRSRATLLNWDNTNNVRWQAFSQDYGCTEANWLIVPSYNPRYTPYYDGRVRLQTVRLMDASLNKMTRISERYRIQFRLESFKRDEFILPQQQAVQ